MPRIDDIPPSNKKFKKKEYRSWDNDLIEKLQLKNKNHVIEKHGIKQQNSNNKEERNVSHLRRFQSGFKTNRDTIKTLISKLSDNEKKVFFCVVNLCAIKSELSTGEIMGNEFNALVGTTRNGRETAIKRLSKKGLVKREKGKRGAKGTLRLSVSELIKIEALNYLTIQKSREELAYQNQPPPEKQVSKKNKTNEAIKIMSNQKDPLPEDWMSINIEPLTEIGLSLAQLQQLYTKSLNTPPIIQESIYQFSFALEQNSKVKKYEAPLNVLMGVLRKGQAWIEPHYQAPQEIAQEQLLKEKEKKIERMQALEKKAYQLALEEWQITLTPEQINEIAPPKKNALDVMPHEVKLSIYFRANVWPEKKKEYLMTIVDHIC